MVYNEDFTYSTLLTYHEFVRALREAWLEGQYNQLPHRGTGGFPFDLPKIAWRQRLSVKFVKN